MIILGGIRHRFIILAASIVVITLIGYLDYLTGRELSFSIFYLIPIAIYALYRGTNYLLITISSVYAAVVWFLVEFATREYSHIFFPIWNAFVRLLIFEIIGLLFIYLKEKENRLQEAKRRLETMNEEKNKFIGIAAHDLRSPISAIYSFSELLIEKSEESHYPRLIEMLSIIRQMSSHTLEVLSQLLDVSKIESGKFDFNVTTQDYVSFVRKQVFINELLAKRKNINIILITETESARADFDEHLLGEVINNLLSNAIKYSYENSNITVKITILTDKILTEVIDRGKGIPEEEQQNLFNYFHRTSTVPTAGEQSTGLGLAIVKRIVILHKGEVGVTSTLNKGSKFYFTLPISYEGLQ